MYIGTERTFALSISCAVVIALAQVSIAAESRVKWSAYRGHFARVNAIYIYIGVFRSSRAAANDEVSELLGILIYAAVWL